MAVLILLCLTCCLMVVKANTGGGSGDSSSGVILDSTLKQSSLCPGEEFTTFSCTASGTDLVWIVGGSMLSFNRNANVGAFRIDPDGNIAAILMIIDSAEIDGHAVRFSVLRVSAQPQVTEMLSVKCHNGSSHLAEEIQYLPRPADPPVRPEMEATVDNKSRVANISWTAPNNEDLSYYAISVDDGPPMLTKNTSILYNLSSSNSERLFSLRALDHCGQQGHTANTTVTVMVLVTSPGVELVPTVTYNGARKDITGYNYIYSIMLIIFSQAVCQCFGF